MEEKQGLRVCVIGWFHRLNVGDSQYEITIPKLFEKHPTFKNAQYTFVCVDDLPIIKSKKAIENADVCLTNMGDSINDYFCPKIAQALTKYKKGPIIGVSVGIPFPSCLRLKYFDYMNLVFTRNAEDVQALKLLLGEKRASFVPDCGFLLKPAEFSPISWSLPAFLDMAQLHAWWSQQSSVKLQSLKPKLGVFLIQSIFKFDDIVAALIHLLTRRLGISCRFIQIQHIKFD